MVKVSVLSSLFIVIDMNYSMHYFLHIRNTNSCILWPIQVSIRKLLDTKQNVGPEVSLICSMLVSCNLWFGLCAMHSLVYRLVSSTKASDTSSETKGLKKPFAVLSTGILLTAPVLDTKGVVFTGAGSWLHPSSLPSSSEKDHQYLHLKWNCRFYCHYCLLLRLESPIHQSIYSCHFADWNSNRVNKSSKK